MKLLVWFTVALTAFLFSAKLAGLVTCSWLVIFTPLIIVLGLWFLFLLMVFAIIGIYALVAMMREK